MNISFDFKKRKNNLYNLQVPKQLFYCYCYWSLLEESFIKNLDLEMFIVHQIMNVREFQAQNSSSVIIIIDSK